MCLNFVETIQFDRSIQLSGGNLFEHGLNMISEINWVYCRPNSIHKFKLSTCDTQPAINHLVRGNRKAAMLWLMECASLLCLVFGRYTLLSGCDSSRCHNALEKKKKGRGVRSALENDMELFFSFFFHTI